MSLVIFLKVAGVCLILTASGYFAYGLGNTLDRRVYELRKMYSILLQLKSEIQYMNTILPDCFLKLSENLSEPFLSWLTYLSEELNKDRTEGFSKIWQEGLNILMENSALCREDLLPLYELSDKLGAMDITAQLKAVDYALLHLERNRTELEDELSGKKKVAVTLSMFCGLMTLILLL